MKRLFLGLSVPSQQIEQLDAAMQPYKNDQHLQGAKWIAPENMHITVLFLGEVVDAHVPEMKTIIRGLAGRMTPFTLHFERIEFFAHKMPKMIWGRFQRNLGFLELNQECKKFTKPYVDRTEEEELKEPIPHVTLAKLHTPVDPKKFSFKNTALDSFELCEMHLYESQIDAHGKHYTILETFPLGL